ncbi:MAG: hypothetical protein GC192_05245 [Bacteroidetes bacterium]|nr:hypothetical protein [Bacteroidota bacterium]
MKNKDTGLIIKLELVWWAITAILLMAVILPIYVANKNFPYLIPNIIFVLTFITLSRYIFMLRYTPIRYAQWLKVLLLICCIPLVIYMIQELHAFTRFADEIGVQALFSELVEKSQDKLVEYTKAEMLFFGVGGILATVIFPFRMIISFWRTHNLGTT